MSSSGELCASTTAPEHACAHDRFCTAPLRRQRQGHAASRSDPYSVKLSGCNFGSSTGDLTPSGCLRTITNRNVTSGRSSPLARARARARACALRHSMCVLRWLARVLPIAPVWTPNTDLPPQRPDRVATAHFLSLAVLVVLSMAYLGWGVGGGWRKSRWRPGHKGLKPLQQHIRCLPKETRMGERAQKASTIPPWRQGKTKVMARKRCTRSTSHKSLVAR